MTSKNVWIVVTKSKPLDGCEIDFDGCEFYFADAYVAIPNDVSGKNAVMFILEKIEKTLKDERLNLADVLMIMRFSPDEWVDQTDGVDSMHDLAAKALETEGVIFSGFRSEEIQGLYKYHYSVQELDAE